MDKPVNYELAKLLKEKGFNLKVVNFYNYGKLSLISDKDRQIGKLINYNPINWNFTKVHFTSAPSIAEVVMWLYENYGIWISVKGDDGKTFKYELHKWIWYESEKTLKQAYVTFGEGIFDINSEKFNSPTEAYESAIEFVLKRCI